MHRRRRPGFTLIEAALAIIILGSAMAALVQLLGTSTMANRATIRYGDASQLSRGFREYTMTLTFDQIVALASKTYTPPLDSRGIAMTDMSGWTQRVTVEGISLAQVTQTIPLAGSTVVRVTIVSTRGRDSATLKWLVFK